MGRIKHPILGAAGARWWCTVLSGLVLFLNLDADLVLAAPLRQDERPPLVGVGAKPGADSCNRLDSRLLRLSEATDPIALAAEMGLQFDGALVRVVLELVDKAPDNYGLVTEAAYANLVQALAPLDQLCALALDPGVVAVRPPFEAAPAVGGGPGPVPQ